MPIQQHGPAPYAPPKAVIEVITAYRERGLRTPFTLDVLMRAGVPESLAPRTLQALKLLDLVDSEGTPVPEFQQAVRSPDDEFKQMLGDLIAGAYSDVFNYVDPSTHDLNRVREAFRTYTPIGQQTRMVTLFIGLLEFCGLDVSAAKAEPKERPQRATGTSRPHQQPRSHRRSPEKTDLPAPLVSLLNDALPKPGDAWPKPKRDQFLKTFEALLDYYFPTTAKAELPPGMTSGNGSEEEGVRTEQA